MNYILYIVLTIFFENGEPLHNEFKLAFKEAKNCEEMRKVIDVGVSFARLSHNLNIEYKGTCKPKKRYISKKEV